MDLKNRSIEIREDDKARLLPVVHEHINVSGHY